MAQDSFWNNREKAQGMIDEANSLRKKIDPLVKAERQLLSETSTSNSRQHSHSFKKGLVEVLPHGLVISVQAQVHDGHDQKIVRIESEMDRSGAMQAAKEEARSEE